MSFTDDCIHNNIDYSAQFPGKLPLIPQQHTAILACMDARMDIYRILGLSEGQAHVIRNAGGLVTQDAIRSLVISQHLLQTREIILIHHTDCGMLTFRDDEFLYSLQDHYGIKPNWAPGSLRSVHDDVAQSLRTLRTISYLDQTQSLRGFVFHVDTGSLEEVFPDLSEADKNDIKSSFSHTQSSVRAHV